MTDRPLTTMTHPGSSQATADLINKLFSHMRGIKPGWRAAFQTTTDEGEAKRQWLEAFRENCLSDWAVIEGGLSKLRQMPGPFLPSVGDFISYCNQWKLERLGMPNERDAFYMMQDFMAPRIQDRDFSKLDRYVYAAFKRIDWPTFREQHTDRQQREFSSAWKRVMSDVIAGKPLPVAEVPEARRIAPSGAVHGAKTNVAEQTLDTLKTLFDD